MSKTVKFQSLLFDPELDKVCLNFKMNKFTLELNQSYWRPQFSQTMSNRLQRHSENTVKYLRRNVVPKKVTGFSD